MRHGTLAGYRRGCRCGECREASRVDKARWRAGEGPGRTPAGLQVHGSHGYKRHGCRCQVCRAGWAATMRAYKARRRARELEQAARGQVSSGG